MITISEYLQFTADEIPVVSIHSLHLRREKSSVSITLTSSKIELKTPQGQNSWATHTHTGNLGAPTTPPIPGS